MPSARSAAGLDATASPAHGDRDRAELPPLGATHSIPACLEEPPQGHPGVSPGADGASRPVALTLGQELQHLVAHTLAQEQLKAFCL